MIKKFLIFSLATLLCASYVSYAQMSDEQVVSFVTQGMAAGKSKNQIGNELLAKGVSASQVKRIMAKYQKGGSTNMSDMDIPVTTTTHLDTSRPMRESQGVEMNVTDAKEVEDTKKVTVLREGGEEVIIYGHNLFKNKILTFEPNENAATPKDYVLGPGDEVIVDVWGESEATIKQKISPEGQIIITQVGPLNLSGLTIDQATKKIRSALSSKYSLSGPDAASKLSVTLGAIRTIQVNVLGEVKTPGTFRLSSLSTVLNALYSAGGISNIGTLRSVMVSRAGKTIATVDLYKFLYEGNSSRNITLNDGDAIIVPTFEGLVKMEGGFKRPLYYEMISGETVADAIYYAGGFVSMADVSQVTIQRKDGDHGVLHTIPAAEFSKFKVAPGDVIQAYTNDTRDVFDNMSVIKGAVLRPGAYEIGANIATVRQLVSHAGGLLDEAFKERAQLIREKPDRTLEIQSIPIGAIMSGVSADIMLKKNDVLIVADKNEIEKKGEVNITGYVKNPGFFEYADGMTIEDLILLAGGFEDGASSSRIDVSRRIIDTRGKEACDTLAKIYTVDIGDSLKLATTSNFKLEPYDIVAIRKAPSYAEQRTVRVSGEALFPGEYTLVSNNERLSDLFKRAGGQNKNAYLEGAVLKRTVSEDERNVRRNMVNMMKRGGNRRDSSLVDKMVISEVYTIGISLTEALANPGSEVDLVLRDGDELVIPSLTNTVRIQGEVMYPNAVSYVKNKTVRYYINQAGGFSNNAKRAKVYVVYMNGKVSVGSSALIVPGCEVVVPSRAKENKLTTAEWLAIGTTAASITTMIATIANMIK